MDPVTALGLAANIVQFVGYACHLVSEAQSIYKSASGLSENHIVLDTVANNIVKLNNQLTAPAAVGAIPDDLRDLASDCKQLAGELLGRLDKIREKQPTRRFRSFVAALKTLLTEDSIKSLARRVEMLRDQMQFQLIATMSGQQSQIAATLNNMVEEDARLETNRAHEIQHMMSVVKSALAMIESDRKLNSATIGELFRSVKELKPVDDSALDLLSERMERLSKSLGQLAAESGTVASEQLVLKSLWFRNLNARREQVASATSNTLSWIFESDATTNFLSWLQLKDGIYWITGKPGSGKSTLMKYLVESQETQKALKAWAGPHQLITANFFFWSAGSDLQKSQEGLFRTVLFEILRHCPELIPSVCGNKLRDHMPFSNSLQTWSRTELWDAIKRLATHDQSSTRFGFFIDGLDEYSGAPEDIVKVLQDLRRLSSLKLCVSSRPLNEFEEAFGYSDFQLRVENFTTDDIRKYVYQELEQDPRFTRSKARDDQYQDLAQEIVDKANGVFLWVFLVVRSLLSGLTNRDRITDLQKRLRLLPRSLEGFFQQMLDSVEEIYKQQMAHTFQLLLYTSDSLELMVLWAIDEELLEIESQSSIKSLTRADVDEIEETMRWRLNGRSMGLLEISQRIDEPDGMQHYLVKTQVRFIHRTARDFLLSKHVQEVLQQYTDPKFHPSSCLCRAYLVLLKVLSSKRLARKDGSQLACSQVLLEIRNVAKQSEIERNEPETAVLDETGKMLPKSAFTIDDVTFGSMLGFAVAGDLRRYVAARLALDMSIVQRHSPSLLWCSLSPSSDWSSEMVKLLLEHGAYPNEINGEYSVWHLYLRNLRSSEPEDPQNPYSLFIPTFEERQITQALLKHGADLQSDVTIAFKTKPAAKETGRAADLYKRPTTVPVTLPARQIIDEVFGAYADEILASSHPRKETKTHTGLMQNFLSQQLLSVMITIAAAAESLSRWTSAGPSATSYLCLSSGRLLVMLIDGHRQVSHDE